MMIFLVLIFRSLIFSSRYCSFSVHSFTILIDGTHHNTRQAIRSKKQQHCSTTPIVATSNDREREVQEEQEHEGTQTKVSMDVDNRPHQKRRKFPRPARRLNHIFQYLHRHDNPKVYDDHTSTIEKNKLSGKDYLILYGGYTQNEVEHLLKEFPPLDTLDVQRHIQPKLRFLKYSILGSAKPISSLCHVGKSIPPYYFGTRLEKVVAPRHAFLMYHNLYNGKILLEDEGHRMKLFLRACKSSSQFANLCNKWKQEIYRENNNTFYFSAEQIEMFETVFRRGLLSCVRSDVPIHKLKVAQIQHISDLVPLFIHHGANVYEKDTRDISLLHWACGVGNNLPTVRCLCQYIDVNLKADRDGATPLHWAVVGVNSKLFGLGGHLDITRFLIEEKGADCHAVTKDGNNVIMWASWAKDSFPIVQYLIQHHNVDLKSANRNGCTIAHWAAGGGNLVVCQYLYENGVDFDVTNHSGNSPLCHAVAYGREEVVLWLKHVVGTSHEAKELANNFAIWMEGDKTRKQILDLF